jgi:hypothetical protein
LRGQFGFNNDSNIARQKTVSGSFNPTRKSFKQHEQNGSKQQQQQQHLLPSLLSPSQKKSLFNNNNNKPNNTHLRSKSGDYTNLRRNK